jgi:hypothetical protein
MSDYDNNNGDYNENAARFAGDTVGSAGKSFTSSLPSLIITNHILSQRAASTAQTKPSTTKNKTSATPSAATNKT